MAIPVITTLSNRVAISCRPYRSAGLNFTYNSVPAAEVETEACPVTYTFQAAKEVLLASSMQDGGRKREDLHALRVRADVGSGHMEEKQNEISLLALHFDDMGQTERQSQHQRPWQGVRQSVGDPEVHANLRSIDAAVKGQGGPYQSFQTPVVEGCSGGHSPLATVRQAANVRDSVTAYGDDAPGPGAEGKDSDQLPRVWGPAQVPAAAVAQATAHPLEASEPSFLKGVWTTACDEELMRKVMNADCESSPDADVAPETMVRHLQHCVQTKPHSVVFRYLPGIGQGIKEMTFETLGEKVRKCAQANILTKSTLHRDF